MSKQTKNEPTDQRCIIYSQPNDKCFYWAFLEKIQPLPKFEKVNVIFTGS